MTGFWWANLTQNDGVSLHRDDTGKDKSSVHGGGFSP